VEIDYCPQCRGVWLDHGELDRILDRSTGRYEQPRRERGGAFSALTGLLGGD
jgi:uncharacterized protein